MFSRMMRKIPFPWLMAAIVTIPLAVIIAVWVKASSLSGAISRAVSDTAYLGPDLLQHICDFIIFSSSALFIIALCLVFSAIVHINREIKFARAAAIRRASHDRYRFLADGPPSIGIARIDLCNAKLTDINRSGITLFGRTRAELIDCPIQKLISQETWPAMEQLLGDLMAGKPNGEVFSQINDPIEGQKIISWHISSKKLSGADPEAIAVIIDVTEKVTAQKEKMEKERLAGVLEMAGGTAHELNQPLQVISGQVWLMLQKLSPADPLYRKLKIISEEVERLTKLGQKIANISSYEVKDYVGNTKIIDIDRAARERELKRQDNSHPKEGKQSSVQQT